MGYNVIPKTKSQTRLLLFGIVAAFILGNLDSRTWGLFLESPETFRAYFGWHNSLCIFKTKASRGTKLCSYFYFYSLYNIWKDQLYRISRSYFYEWLFGSEKFSGLSRNGPLDSNPDLCDAGAVLHQLSYDANCELVIIWFYGKPVDCGYTYLRRSSALKYCFHPQFTNMKFHALILHDI